MRDTGSLPEDVAVPNRAHAYTRWGRTLGRCRRHAAVPRHRGRGGYSTAGDLLKFARAAAGKLLPPGLLGEATRKQTPWYGYGFMVGGTWACPASATAAARKA